MFTGQLPNVIILDDGNWPVWMNQARMIIGSNGLIDLLEEPASTTKTENPGKPSTEERTKHFKAMLALTGTISMEDRQAVKDCTTVREMLAMLKVMRVRPENLYSLNERFSKLTWSTEMSAERFIVELKELRTKITTAKGSSNTPAEDSVYVWKLLGEMPDYLMHTRRHFENQIFSIGQDEPTTVEFEKLCTHVVQAYIQAKADRDKKKAREPKRTE